MDRSGSGQAELIELVVAEAQGRRLRGEPTLVAEHVLDVLGADVAGLHDLGDGALGCGGPEQLDEEGEPKGLAMDRAAPCGE